MKKQEDLWPLLAILLFGATADQLPQCPEGFTETETFCYILAQKCPFPDVQPFSSYKNLVEKENLSPVWMPVQRNVSGLFQWTELSFLYKTVFNYQISGNVSGKNCMVFYNSSHMVAASCAEEYPNVCVYSKITSSENRLCRQEGNCRESDFGQTTKCFCVGAGPEAEFLKMYQNSIYGSLTSEVCSFGLERTPQGTFVWSRSKQELSYDYWSNETVFDDLHKYPALTPNGWVLTETPAACQIVEKDLEDLSPAMELIFDYDNRTFGLHLSHALAMKELDVNISVYCFTDAHPEELVHRYSNMDGDSISGIQFKPLDYGPGTYWCEGFQYSNLKLLTTSMFLRLGQFPEFVGILKLNYDSFSQDLIKTTLGFLNSVDYISSYYTARIMKIVDLDDSHLALDVHFSAKFENSTDDTDLELLKDLVGKIQQFELVNFLSSDYCPPFVEELSWPKTKLGTQTKSQEYCFYPNGRRQLRFCGGNFLDGAQWSPVRVQCQVLRASKWTKSLEALFNTYNVHNFDTIAEISGNYQSLKALDVYFIGQFFELFQPSEVQTELDSMFQAVDNLLSVGKTTLKEAQFKTSSTDNFVDVLDRTLSSKLPRFVRRGTNFYVTTNSSSGLLVQKSGDSFIAIPLTGSSSLENITKTPDLVAAIWLSPELLSQMSDDDNISFVFFESDVFFSESVPKSVSQVFYVRFSAIANGPVNVLHVDDSEEKSCAFWDFKAGQVQGSWRVVNESQHFGSFQVCQFWQTGYLALVTPCNITSHLIDLLENGYAVREIVSRLLNISAQYDDFGSEDVHLVGKILEKIGSSWDVNLEHLTQIVSNLLRIDKSTLAKSQSENRATDLILYNIDRIVKASRHQSSSFCNITDNFIVFFADVGQLVFTGLLLLNDHGSMEVETLHEHVDIEDLAQTKNFDSAIILSSEVTKQMYKNSKVIVTVFFTDAFFSPFPNFSTSKVFGVILPEIGDYSGPVSVSHKTLNQKRSQKCAHWSYNPPENISGLWTIDNDGQSSSSFTQCDYWHTAHFVLLQSTEGPVETWPSFKALVLTVTSILSLICLYGVLLTAILFKKWRQNTGNRILLCFVIAVSFELSLYYVAYEERAVSLGLCIALGAIYHYSVIAEFCWMFVIGILQFKRFVIVFGTTPKYLFLKACVIGWGLPLIPVLVLLVFDHNAYVNRKSGFCYPHGLALVLSVWLPVAIIMFFNSIIFFFILYSVCCRKSDGVGSNEVLHQWKLAVFLFFMLGLSWTFGLLSNFKFGEVFGYLFNITANLQGMVIFLYFIVLNKKTRCLYTKAFKKWFRRDH